MPMPAWRALQTWTPGTISGMGGIVPEAEVTLRDGSRVLVRPVEPGDKELFRRGWERFGEESRYRRFMSAKPGLSERELTYFTDVDHENHEAIGARDAETGEGVGVARYVRLPGHPEIAEAAVSVVDEWQGRGVGGELLRRLTARAREQGIERFQASLFAFNHSMLALFEDVGEVEVHDQGSGQLEIDVELPCDREKGLGAALRAAAQGLVRLRP
jgi:RimJ/RimL family protein N-acetyltransferase